MTRRVVAVLAVLFLLCGVEGCQLRRRGVGPPPRPAATGSCSLVPTHGLAAHTLGSVGPGQKPATRTYQLYVPQGVGPGSRSRLLISLHGLAASGIIQNIGTGWSRFADRQAASGDPFITVLPDGIDTLWFWGLESSYDVTFLYQLAAELVDTGCVDATQVYVDGWSEGAFMAQRMACAAGDPAVDTHGILLAGVASYAAGDPAIGCTPRQPTPLILSQGLSDTLVRPDTAGFPAYRAWTQRYGCAAPTRPLSEPQLATGCSHGTRLAWWPIAGQGHLQWSCPEDPLWHNAGIWAFLTAGTPPSRTHCGPQ